MAGGQKFTLTFDAQLNVGQMKGALNQIQSTLNGLHLPQNLSRGLQSTIDSLNREVQNFEVALGKDITGKADFNKLNAQAQKITNAFERLKLQVRDITGLSGKDLEKLFPSQVTQNINNATTAINQYKQGLKDAKDEVSSAGTAVNKLKSQLDEVRNKKPMSDVEWKQLKSDITSVEAEIANYESALEKAKQTATEVENRTSNYKKSSTWRQAQADIESYNKELENARAKLAQLTQARATGITNTKQAQEIENLNNKLTQAQERFNAAQQALQQFESAGNGGGLQKLIEQIGQLTGQDMSNFTGGVRELGEIVGQYMTQQLGEASTKLQQLKTSADQATPAFEELDGGMRDSADAFQAFDNQLRDVSALKSRIQYFFGIANSINLVKRAIRSAFETIKELDKAMTETAVVTNYTVKDMWNQLPEYTKRANELGVTTKDAYESATLYFQQGLNNDQAAALSVETLKMARIAGLEAAEATDRMTNALRGFNMELNTASAQRVDDVYSQLAAMSASNVDEISTAMTKVASLAHSANMEFETTAAFLAQIIETTRESAETAGTALKTVVARFSEVKKLVDTDQLKGTDEEGQGIDVNKVSAALRTAGIDLNKYFIGEVGLDDIFMELASKWDSLTSVQQRYIATQAAGSRQQSRFIALMQDYARTQELVSAAYGAEGASARQFEKTQESLQSKLARLKNAWDEFLMGLTNSTIVKGFVDTLTLLLNIVNKLTSGFGEGTSSVLKWIAALTGFAGIKAAWRSLDPLLMSGLQASGKGALANGAVRIGLLSGLIRNGTAAQPAPILSGQAREIATGNAQARSGRQGSILLGGLGGLGKKAWDSLQLFGVGQQLKGGFVGKIAGGVDAAVMKLGGSASLAMGLSGLAPILLGIATAATAAQIAYKAWEKYTPAGQLKVATQLAEKQAEIAQKANETAKAYQQVQEKYKEYQDAIDTASSKVEYDAAVKSQNDYILSLIEQDSSYAKYLESTTKNGQVVLTLNTELFDKDLKDAEEKASEETTKSYFTNAEEQRAKIKVEETNAQNYRDAAAEKELYYISSEEERVKETAAEIAAENARASMAAQARLGYQSLLKDSGLSDESKDLIATALSQAYETIGQVSESDLKELTGSSYNEGISRLMSVLADDISDVNLLDEEILASFNFDEASGPLQQFGKLLGLNNNQLKTLKNNIQNTINLNREIQENNKKALSDQLQKINPNNNYNLDQLAPDIQALILGILENLGDLLPEDAQKGLADFLLNPETTKEQLSEIESFKDSINLDDPIGAYFKLQEGLTNSNKGIQELSKSTLKANIELFNYSNLIRSSLTDAYDVAGDEIDKLIEKNGEITADDIEDLAQSSSSLAKILELDIANASQLAKALTLVGQNKIQIDDLSESFINALDGAQTFKSIIDDIHKTISEFDEGADYGEGIDFLTDKTGELKELIDNFEFGNQRTAKLWELLFGSDYKQAWEQGEDFIRDRVSDMEKWLDNDGYGFFNDKDVRSQLGIKETGDHQLRWDKLGNYESYNELLEDVKTAGGGLSDEAARMFLAAFASHGDYDTANKLEELSIGGVADKILDEFKVGKDKVIIKDSELQALADSYGVEYDKVVEAIKARLDDKDNLKIFGEGKGISGKDLYEYFAKQLGGDSFDPNQFLDKIFQGKPIDLTQLKSHLASMGYTDPSQQIDLASSILEAAGLDLDNEALNLSKLEVAIKDARVAAEAANINVDDLISAIETACQDKDVNVNGLSTVITDPSVKNQADVLVKIGEAITKDTRAVVPLNNLAASLLGMGIVPGQAAILVKNLAEQLTTGGPINLENALTGLDLTTPEAQQLIQDMQKVLENCGYTVDLGSIVSEPSEATAKKYASGLVGKIQKALVDMGFDPADFVQNRSASYSGFAQISDNEKDNQQAITDVLQHGVTDGVASGMKQGQVVITTNIDEAVSASDLEPLLVAAMNQAGVTGAANIKTDLEHESYIITIDWTWGASGPPNITSGAFGGTAKGTRARGVSGGGGRPLMATKAAGGHQLQAGEALTGEEGPEIVWNKEQGYAYVTGEHGPEFRHLNPGDRVFNANETARIFARSFAKGGIYQSLATGRWNPKNDKDYKEPSKGGGGSGSGADSEKESEWKNEIDWIYNLVEDIEELERKQTKLQEDYEDYLQDQTKTGKDLYNLLIQQLGNLYTQLNHQQAALELREREMREFMDTTNEFDDLLWYNWNDRTLEIDWDAIEALQDKDTYDKVSDLVSQAEAIQKKMDDADDSIIDIKNQIQELENIWRDTYVDFESRVFDAVVSYYQEIIDNYSELHNTLTDSNSQILNSLQKEISLQRQIRDNTKTEEEITNDEAQLAYLRRDTSGGNDLAALQLERELAESRQSYEDTLVDQAISRLEEDNDAAAQQRQQQIDIMQAQLDYQSQNGEFNAYVSELLTSAMGAEGELLTNSDLANLLKEQENWAAMSDVSKEVWEEELNTTFKEVAAFLLKQNAEENGTFYTALTAAVNTVSTAIGSYSQAITKMTSGSGEGSSSGGGSGGGSGGSNSPKKEVESPKSATTGTTYDFRGIPIAYSPGSSSDYTGSSRGLTQVQRDILKKKKYATGGLNTQTGPAWLDGTPSEPEYVLNARQTDAFLKLADVLPSIMGSGAGAQTNTFGGTYITMPVTLESVSPDYDVDRMVDLLKDKLYDSSMYRNNNVLSFIR